MTVRRFDDLVHHPDDGRLDNEATGRSEHLRPKAARLLECLLDHAGEVVPRETLIDAVWGGETVVDFDAGLAALLRELRRALRSVGGPSELIETVPRRGYRIHVTAAPGRKTRRWPRWALVGVLVLAAVSVGTVLGIRLVPDRPADDAVSQKAELNLAILPFEIFGDADDLPPNLDLLLADTVLAELLARPVDGLSLIGRTSLRPYLERDDVAAAAAADLGVDLLVEGSVRGGTSAGWRVEMRLLVVPPGRVAWSAIASGRPGEPLEVVPVAGRLAGDLVEAWPDLRGQVRRGEPAG